MRKAKWNYNIVIYFLMICFAALCLAGAYFFHKSVEKENNLPFVAHINCDNAKEELFPWLNESDGCYYLFLPAECKTLKVSGNNSTQICIEGFGNEEEIPVESLEMGMQYTAIADDQIGSNKTISVVFMQSSNIPALFINTESGDMDYIDHQKGNAEQGTYQILALDTGLTEGNLVSFEGRGNTSWTNCEKKGYKFTLEEPKSLLGLRASTEWVLTANARSNYLSNSVSFWLEDEIGMEYTTDAVFVDVYFNGAYHGNYILCERISTGVDGIPIRDLENANEEANSGEKITNRNQYVDAEGRFKAYTQKHDPFDISGGYLIERDVPEYYADEDCGIILSTGDHYVIHEPSLVTVSEAEYLWSYMEELHQAVAAPDGYNDNGVYYTEYLDIESFALKYVLEEFLAFNDAGRSSAYYYKDAGDVLKAGPGWDFEGAFLGNAQALTMLNGTSYSTALFEQLMQHEEFRTLVYQLYTTRLRPAIQILLEEKFYEFRDLIADSAEMDEIRWGREDFFASCKDILSWIDVRVKFLDQHWNSNEEWITLKFISDYSNNQYLYLRPGECVTQCMVDQLDLPLQVTQWIDENGETLTLEKPLYEDVELFGVSVGNDFGMVNRSLGYARQILPELLFSAIFLCVFILFIIQNKQGRWKK